MVKAVYLACCFQHVCLFSVTSVMSSSLEPHGLQSARLLCPWDSSGKNTGVGCHFFLQGIFLAQGLNQGLLYCRQFLYCLSHQGSPRDPLDPLDWGSNPCLLYWQVNALLLSHQRSPQLQFFKILLIFFMSQNMAYLDEYSMCT